MSLAAVVRRILAPFILLLILPATAFADIKAYNAAVGRRDFAAAVTEAEGIWATFDKTKPEAATIAREFAWTAMRAKQPAPAKTYAKWLVDNGAALPTPDDDPQLARVLFAWSSLGPKPSGGARKGLSDALKEWLASSRKTGPVIPVAAATDLWSSEWAAGQWVDTRRDAPIAADLAGLLGPDGGVLEQQARLGAIAADYMQSPRLDPFFAMADLHDAMMDLVAPTFDPAKQEDYPLYELDMRAHAWMDSMVAALGLNKEAENSAGAMRRDRQRVAERRVQLKGPCGTRNCPPKALPPGTLPQCADATWRQVPKLIYPSVAAYKGFVGTLALKLTTDESGAVTDATIITAVPSAVFPEYTLNAVRKWSLVKPSAPAQPCTVAGTRTFWVSYAFSAG